MKPLPLPSFTDEDMAIWLDRCARREMRWGMWLNERAVESDRRDAELMLQYVQCTVPKGRHAQIGGECGWFAGQTQL